MGELRKRYNEEFKRQAVKFVQEQKKTVTEIAADLDIPLSTLHEWIAKYREFENEPVASSERVRELENQLKEKERELNEQKRKNKDTEEELAIVKKAVHIFSNPNQ